MTERSDDTLARLAFDASERIPKFLLPVLRHQLETGGEFRRCAFTLAAWARFMEGVSETGEPTPINDVRSADLAEAVRREQTEPGAFLDYRPVFGNLGADRRLREAYLAYRAAIADQGVRATIAGIAGS